MLAINWNHLSKELLSLDGVRTRVMEHGPWILSVFFTVWIAVYLVDITWKIMPATPLNFAPESRQGIRNAKMKAKKGRSPPQLIANEIAKAHLFGIEEVEAIAAQDIPNEVAKSTSRLKLRGVIATNVPGEAMAVIEDSGKADYFSVDDPLPDGSTLVKVHSDKVIIERNGRFESLALQESELASIQEVPRNFNFAGNRPTPSSMQRINTAETRKLLGNYKRTLQTNPQSLMGLVRASPVSVGGKLKGYRIRPGRDPGLFRKFGLRAGDVITSINGVDLNDPFKALEIVRDLRDTKELNVEVLRNGVSQSLSYDVGE